MTAPKGAGGGHTPGPWFADKPFYSIDLRQRVTPIYAHDADRFNGLWLVAWCHHEAVPAKQRMHNARLIADAPLMAAQLAAVDKVLTEYEGMTGAGYRYIAANIRAALAKAGGSHDHSQ